MGNPFDQFDSGAASPNPAGVPASSPLDTALAAEGLQNHPVADLARSIYQQESSSGANTQTSNRGAVGGMQVMPATFKSVADPGWNINDPVQNAQAGVRYLKTMYDASGGNPTLTAAGYYGGPGGMLKAAQGVSVSDPKNPSAPNTLQYARQVTSRLPAGAPATAQPGAANPFDQFDGQQGPQTTVQASTPQNSSFLSNLGNGLVKGANDIRAGFQERLREGMTALGAGNVADSMGLATPEYVAQKRQQDAPLMQTAGGKIGDFAATALPGAAAMFIPGAQGIGGAIALSAAQGLLEPTTKDESVLKNTIAGAAGGALGYGAAKGIGAAANSVLQSATTKAAQNASKDSIAAIARDSGYVIPPTQTNPTILNSALEGISGKIATGQKASLGNQAVTNRLAAQELGLPTDQPITQAALSGLRKQAGQAYDAVAQTGTVTPTSAYGTALDQITAPYLKAAQGFPGAPVNPVVAKIDALRSSQFDAGSAVAKISELRDAASAAFSSGDKATGTALKSGANALEDALDTHLQTIGAPADMLQNFRDARTQIAKSYSVGNALNDSTGAVNAAKIGAQASRGAPLSGNLKKIADIAQAYPTAVREVTSSMPGISPLDFMGAGASGVLSGIAGGAVPGALTSAAMLATRPTIRAAILSKPFQNTLATPSYGGSTILNALGSTPGQALLRGAVPAGVESEAQNGYANGGIVRPNAKKLPKIADVAR